MAGTVSTEQLDKLNYTIGPKATSLATAVIRLHSSDGEEKKWVYSGLCGALCLVIDRKLGGVALFRMYDLNSFNLVFEAELYYEFEAHYQELNDNFYCFPIPGGHHIGFSFADSEEALLFRSLAAKYAPRSQNHNRNEDRIKRFALPTEVEVVKKKPGFFKGLFSKKKMSEDGEEVSIDNYKISRPENAIHENHIGWDAKNQTFDLSQLSRELKRVFKKAGIRKKDLKDTNTALLIADAILNQPLPDSNPKKKGKKGADKESAKKDKKGDEHHSEHGTPQIGLSRSPSIIGSGLKPLQLNPPMSAGSAQKSGFQSNIPSAGDKKSMNLSKQEEMSLTSKLATAMAQRRKALTKHDVESEEDDWSEDD